MGTIGTQGEAAQRRLGILNIPRLLLSASSSGAGKTSLSLGLLAAFRRRGLLVQPCKLGPDYLDAALHAAASGRPAAQYDPRLQGRDAGQLLARRTSRADLCLIEGAMGYYDGCTDQKTSAYDAARSLGTPALLVLDARAASESLAAVALGFLRFRRDSRIRGFILNRLGSPAHAEKARQSVERATGLPVLGAIPRNPAMALPERHLGLIAPESNPDFMATLSRLGDTVGSHCDIDAIHALALTAPPIKLPSTALSGLLNKAGSEEPRFRLAIAMDEAFAFYYQDNLDILRALGAELVPFSPLRDPVLPPDCKGLYLGGGYPESHLRELAANTALHASIRDAVATGLPVWAECGGYMYLCTGITDNAGTSWPLLGCVPWRARMTTGLQALGYYEATSTGRCAYLPAGMRLSGHCFHWSQMDDHQEVKAALRLRKGSGADWAEGYAIDNVYASYLHLHFANNLLAVRRFVRACLTYRPGRKATAPRTHTRSRL